jgi:hypothetical protein
MAKFTTLAGVVGVVLLAPLSNRNRVMSPARLCINSPSFPFFPFFPFPIFPHYTEM